MSDWVDVNEKLPELGIEVWAAFRGQFEWIMFPARMTRHNGLYAAGYSRPTYWMPLPSPPEQIKGNKHDDD